MILRRTFLATTSLGLANMLGRKGVKRVIECGPGRVLVGLSKRIVPDIEYIAITDSAALTAAAAQG